MSVFLLDVNVLLALSWPGHIAHDRAEQWFARNARKGWATCPIVEAGFVRILSNPAYSKRAVSAKEALEALKHNVQHPAHQFWPDDVPASSALDRFAGSIAGHQQVMDAYLLALAIHHRGKLATLDARLTGWLKDRAFELSHIEFVS